MKDTIHVLSHFDGYCIISITKADGIVCITPGEFYDEANKLSKAEAIDMMHNDLELDREDRERCLKSLEAL